MDTSLNVETTPPDEASEEVQETEWPWHPISVTNDIVNGFNSIRMTYALPHYINPAVIPTANFQMFGQQFIFAYIVQQATVHEDSREVRQTVTIDSASRNINDLLPYLEQTITYNRDGFAGTLALDLQSITSEVAGTSRTTSTATRHRTFPHLPTPDNALIPPTITEGGLTFYLASVRWADGTSTAVIDGHAVSSTFTATATYTTQVTNTRTTGYITTAVYTGTVFRAVQGATLYTVVFYGDTAVEVILPDAVVNTNIRHQAFTGLALPNNALVPQAIVDDGLTFYLATVDWVPVNTPSADGQSVVTTYTANATFATGQATEQSTGGEIGNVENAGNAAGSNAANAPGETRESSGTGGLTTVLAILGVLIGIGALGAAGYYGVKYLIGKNATVFCIDGPMEIVKAGKVKIDLESPNPTVDLGKVVGENTAQTDRYIIRVAQRAMPKLVNKEVQVVLHDNETFHSIPGSAVGEPMYEFEINFSDDD